MRAIELMLALLLLPLPLPPSPLSRSLYLSLSLYVRASNVFYIRFGYDSVRCKLCMLCEIGSRPMANISAILGAESSEKFRIQLELPISHTSRAPSGGNRLLGFSSCAHQSGVIRNFCCVTI